MPPSFATIFRDRVDGRITEHEYIAQLCFHLTQMPLREDLDLMGTHDDPFATMLQGLVKSFYFKPIKDLPRYEQVLHDCVDNNLASVRLNVSSCAQGDPFPEALQVLACLAAKKGHSQILEICLDAGAEFDNHLNSCARKGVVNMAMLDFLLKVDFQGVRTSKQSLQRLSKSCWGSPPEVLLAMYKMGVRADILQVSNGISTGDLPLENIKVMLEEGRAKEHLEGSRALQEAAQLNRVETVRVLLDAGAHIDEIPESGDFRVRGPYQALWNAAREGHVDMVKLLLSRGSRLDLDNGRFHSLPNGTALDIARKQGHTEIVALLEEALHASAKE